VKRFYVYLLANESRHLYTGFTSALLVRVHKHRVGYYASYTKRFRITRLVHWEEYGDAMTAIAREKQLKRWPRWRKIELVEQHNAGWRDLARDWFPDERRHLDHGAPGEG
jgi:putative endonuclease